MPVSRKKVIVRKLSRDWLSGYLPPSAFVAQEQVQVLDLAGKLVSVHMSEVKWICFVRDFQSGDANQPERLLRKTFVTRPRSQGLWIRARLKDNDLIEGLAQNDLTLLDGRACSSFLRIRDRTPSGFFCPGRQSRSWMCWR